MKYLQFSIIVLILFYSSCSTSFESINNGIVISKDSDHIIIQNNSENKIYFFVVEQHIQALIDWAPSKSGPGIKSGKLLKIPYYDIFNGKTEPVKPGDKVVVYWWTDSLTDFNDVQFNVIKL